MKLSVKKIDFEKDFNRAGAAYCLISNILSSRIKVINNDADFTHYLFQEDFESQINWKDHSKFEKIEFTMSKVEFCS